MKIFDGCTEFGSETVAFRDRGHDVTTLGVEGDVDIKKDIRDFHTKEHYDFMWFSPPCTDFSIAKGKKCKDWQVDLSVVKSCYRVVAETNPTFWIIENPRGCLRHFIGLPVITIKYSDYGFVTQKPTDLWGMFPWFWSVVVANKKCIKFEKLRGFTKEDRAKRSLVPYGLSLSLCVAMERAVNENAKDFVVGDVKEK